MKLEAIIVNIGTNIIKSFPELDKRIRSIPRKFLDL